MVSTCLHVLMMNLVPGFVQVGYGEKKAGLLVFLDIVMFGGRRGDGDLWAPAAAVFAMGRCVGAAAGVVLRRLDRGI
jgi:hypothetical protein